jgi:hypothetical protein
MADKRARSQARRYCFRAHDPRREAVQPSWAALALYKVWTGVLMEKRPGC